MGWINDLKPLLDLLNGLVSPVLATTLAYIAYQQWKTNSRKERRESTKIDISIYGRIKSHLKYIDATREIRSDLYEGFEQACAEADFIFPKEVTKYLNRIDILSSQWLRNNECLDCAAPDADRASINKMEVDMEKYMNELQKLHCGLLELFERHIKK